MFLWRESKKQEERKGGQGGDIVACPWQLDPGRSGAGDRTAAKVRVLMKSHTAPHPVASSMHADKDGYKRSFTASKTVRRIMIYFSYHVVLLSFFRQSAFGRPF